MPQIPLHEVLLKAKQYLFIIDSLPSRTVLISGTPFGLENKYYQLIDFITALLSVIKVENDKAYVESEELEKALLGKEVDLYTLFKAIENLIR